MAMPNLMHHVYQETIQELIWELLGKAPYCLGLAPRNFHHFGTLREHTSWWLLPCGAEVEHEIWL
jgi:hypothetical protein